MSFLKSIANAIGRALINVFLWEDIFSAAENGRHENVSRLLALGEDPNAMWWVGIGSCDTALYLAAKNGHTEAVRALLAGGADPSLPNGDIFQYTPLHAAVDGNHFEAACLLLQAGADINARTKPANMRPLDLCKGNALLASMLGGPPVSMKLRKETEGAIQPETEGADMPALHSEAQAVRRRMTKHIQPAPRL